MTERNIILAGLGPHARRIYYPLLEKHAAQYGLALRLVIDLDDQADTIQRYLAGRRLQPARLFLANSSERNGSSLSPSVVAVLEDTVRQYPIHGMIISTEPKAHKPYALWAIDHGIDVLMDKPITAPAGAIGSIESARQVHADYIELQTRLEKSKANLIVQCQRRSHAGYQFIKRYLADFVRGYQIPLSFIDLYHADGMWCMPHELFSRENHPYKYGYGKLMHSGYHFVDLFVWLAEVNRQLPAKCPERAEIVTRRFSAYDLLHQFTAADCRRLFGSDRCEPFYQPERMEAARRFGELDVFALCQLKRSDVVVTTGVINLQQNSFSRRSWIETPEDVYKGNGRVRHERLSVQVGNLLNIQAHSYQSYEVHKKDVETEGVGHEDHFEVNIFRNSGVVGGPVLEKLDIGEAARRLNAADPSYLGHNESAREANLLSFLERRPAGLDLGTHRLTSLFVSKLYECMARENAGELPLASFPLDS